MKRQMQTTSKGTEPHCQYDLGGSFFINKDVGTILKHHDQHHAMLQAEDPICVEHTMKDEH
jgi:hypothetical protein